MYFYDVLLFYIYISLFRCAKSKDHNLNKKKSLSLKETPTMVNAMHNITTATHMI